MIHTLASSTVFFVNCYANETLSFYSGKGSGTSYNEGGYFEIGKNGGKPRFIGCRAGY